MRFVASRQQSRSPIALTANMRSRSSVLIASTRVLVDTTAELKAGNRTQHSFGRHEHSHHIAFLGNVARHGNSLAPDGNYLGHRGLRRPLTEIDRDIPSSCG